MANYSPATTRSYLPSISMARPSSSAPTTLRSYQLYLLRAKELASSTVEMCIRLLPDCQRYGNNPRVRVVGIFGQMPSGTVGGTVSSV